MIVEPESGLTINICAVAGLAPIGTTLDMLDNFIKAPANASGLPVTLALPASASYSRHREMAVCTSVAATGAIIAMALALIALLSSLPKKHSSVITKQRRWQ
jgi:hypothetical protein